MRTVDSMRRGLWAAACIVMITAGLVLVIWTDILRHGDPDSRRTTPRGTAHGVPAGGPGVPTPSTDEAAKPATHHRDRALDDHLDRLRHLALQADAIAIEIDLYLNWARGDSREVKGASEFALECLQPLTDELAALSAPPAAEEASGALLRVLAAYREGYSALAAESAPDPSTVFAPAREAWPDFAHQLRAALKAVPGPPPDVGPPEPDFADPHDGERYRRAIELMEARDYRGAASLLADLQSTNPGNPYVLLRRADCIVQVSRDGEVVPPTDMEPTEASLQLITQVLEAGYSPLLCEAFLQWRTLTQSYWHGVSNYSDIPNWEYNEKRWEAVLFIKEHLAENPADAWAQGQKEMLLSLPNIERGGFAGNTNLMLWGLLYASDVLEDTLGEAPEGGAAQ